IIEWHVKEGDPFEEGDVLLEVATDKVDNEVPAPAAGKMAKHLFSNGDVVPIGEVIAILELSENIGTSKTSDKKLQKPEIKKAQVSKSVSTLTSTSTSTSPSTSFKVNENIFISPLVDSIARKNHISYEELARISGTGKDGRLRK